MDFNFDNTNENDKEADVESILTEKNKATNSASSYLDKPEITTDDKVQCATPKPPISSSFIVKSSFASLNPSFPRYGEVDLKPPAPSLLQPEFPRNFSGAHNNNIKNIINSGEGGGMVIGPNHPIFTSGSNDNNIKRFGGKGGMVGIMPGKSDIGGNNNDLLSNNSNSHGIPHLSSFFSSSTSSSSSSSSSSFNPENRNQGMSLNDPAGPFVRFDDIMPRNAGDSKAFVPYGNVGSYSKAPIFPGEPDPDHMPPYDPVAMINFNKGTSFCSNARNSQPIRGIDGITKDRLSGAGDGGDGGVSGVDNFGFQESS